MAQRITLSAATLLLLLAANVNAHRINVHARAEPTTEAEMSAILGDAECTPYTYQPVVDALNKKEFPTPWELAKDVQNDPEGLAKFNSFSANIPDIKPKARSAALNSIVADSSGQGTNGVADANIQYDQAADPDCWWTRTQCLTPKHPGVDADIAEVPEPKTLGYGFDDGPACNHNAFYNYLASKKQKATMFYIGSNVMYNPLQAQRAVADGHEICVHTWSHAVLTALSNEQVFAELWYSLKAIKLVTGYTPTCMRPPTGDVDDRVRFIAQQLGLTNVMWKTDSFDWAAADHSQGVDEAKVQENYDSLIAAVKNGDYNDHGAIFLTHELSNYTMQTAVTNYPKLAAVFDHIVPVGVAFNKTQPYVETGFNLPSFAAYIGGATTADPSASASAASTSPSGSSSNNANTGNTHANANSTTNSTTGDSAGTRARIHLPVAALAVLAAVAFTL
ncbi:NodB-like proteiny domain-containing protein [Mycena kentingensis (nom. inval.)]|nr:NodB-like proteiny domain-containing protein [Mycena kentingensis (nom. inval.)]